VRRLNRLWVYLLFCLMLMGLPIGGCRIWPVESSYPTAPDPGQSATESAGTIETMASAAPTASETTALTPAPTPVPTPSAASTPTAGPVPTTPASEAETTATDDLNRLDNQETGWYFIKPASLDQDMPATIPESVKIMISRYPVIWQMPPRERKRVYLTMDEGYEYAGNTDLILDIAREKGISITFFITGNYLANNPQKVERMLDEGHLVANHTQKHANLADLLATAGDQAVLDQVRTLEQAFTDQTGRILPRLVRPPEGRYSERLLAVLGRAGYTVVFWSFAYRDWLTDDQPDPDAARQRILGELHDGSVILLHAASTTNVTILPDLIDAIQARGYEFSLP